jgi:hypothetical protein
MFNLTNKTKKLIFHLYLRSLAKHLNFFIENFLMIFYEERIPRFEHSIFE